VVIRDIVVSKGGYIHVYGGQINGGFCVCRLEVRQKDMYSRQESSQNRPSRILKPTDPELISARNHLVQALEQVWPQLGWNLENPDPTALRSVLKILPEGPAAALSLLRHGSSSRGTRVEFRGTFQKERRRVQSDIERIQNEIGRTHTHFQALDRMLKNPLTRSQRKALRKDRVLAVETIKILEIDKSRLMEASEALRVKARERDEEHTFSELLNFCQSHRSRVTPRRTANALAGLPLIGWRQSAKRCSDYAAKYEKYRGRPAGGIRYETVQMLRRAFYNWDPKERSLIHEVESYLRRRTSTPTWVVRDLCKNWRFLRKAIGKVRINERERDKFPYLVAAKYFEALEGKLPESERYLAEKECLQPPSQPKVKAKIKVLILSDLSPVRADDKP
jgi:hypothetical protein